MESRIANVLAGRASSTHSAESVRELYFQRRAWVIVLLAQRDRVELGELHELERLLRGVEALLVGDDPDLDVRADGHPEQVVQLLGHDLRAGTGSEEHKDLLTTRSRREPLFELVMAMAAWRFSQPRFPLYSREMRLPDQPRRRATSAPCRPLARAARLRARPSSRDRIVGS